MYVVPLLSLTTSFSKACAIHMLRYHTTIALGAASTSLPDSSGSVPFWPLHAASTIFVALYKRAQCLFWVLQYNPQQGKYKVKQTPRYAAGLRYYYSSPTEEGRKHRTFKRLLLFHKVFLWGLLQASIVKWVATVTGCSLMQSIHHIGFSDSWSSVLSWVLWKACYCRLGVFS